ncbi:hypothetical protein C8R46DRAFT_1145835, partial [Mycena filopes]
MEASPTPQTPRRYDPLRYHAGGYGGIHYSPEGNILVAPAPTRDAEESLFEDDHRMSALPELEYPETAAGSDIDNDDNMSQSAVSSIAASAFLNDRAIDLTNPVFVFAWCHGIAAPLVLPAYPRLRAGSVHGHVLLSDLKTAMRRSGFPIDERIERTLSFESRSWVSVEWDHEIPVFGRDQVMYLKNPGVEVTLPDHVFLLGRFIPRAYL